MMRQFHFQGMTFELLWTDQCFLLLLILGLWIILFSLRKRPIRKSFAIILHRPLAVSAGVLMLFFLSLGILDSIHVHTEEQGTEVELSILDKILYPLGTSYEKTYSAPLALKLYVKEIEIRQGVAKQGYPRLKYVPRAIKNKEDRNQHIQQVFYQALLYGVFGFLGAGFIFVLLQFWRTHHVQLKLSPSGWSALITISFLVFMVVFSYGLSRVLHVLGTGQIGQDIFYFSIKSIRTGLVIGLLTTLFMLPLALFLGIAAGYFGGVIDDVIQYTYTTLSSIPGVLLITASVLSLQTYITNHPEQFPTLAESADARLLALCFILGVTSWTSLCRLLRAETLKLREIDFVVAARAQGSGWFTIIRKHLLPNVMHLVIITLVLDFSFLVMAEAVLSYVGVGVSPMTISWGNMINGARLELARDPVVWWPMGSAFLFMFLLVLATNLFADAVRDAFDPHH
jgi:peptide/nickel transport system permease protein